MSYGSGGALSGGADCADSRVYDRPCKHRLAASLVRQLDPRLLGALRDLVRTKGAHRAR
jgi:hypothetical protein